MSKFMGGTWTACKDGSIQIKDSEGHILSMYRDVIASFELEVDDLTTTRLIAAAPEMYELLNALVHREYDNTVTTVLISKAQELLARIDGEEE